jgi:hypothetical protein
LSINTGLQKPNRSMPLAIWASNAHHGRPFPPASFSISYDQTLDKRPRAALQVKSGFDCLGVSPQGTAKSGKIAMEYSFRVNS